MWDNYTYILNELPFSRWFFNTILVALVVTFGTVVIRCPRGPTHLPRRVLGPRSAVWPDAGYHYDPRRAAADPGLSHYQPVRTADSYGGLIIPSLANVLGVFLLRQFMQTLPEELEHAARIDGCSEFGVFWRIIMPLSTPALATLSIVVFTAQWNNLVWPLVVLNNKKLYTPPFGSGVAAQRISGELRHHLRGCVSQRGPASSSSSCSCSGISWRGLPWEQSRIANTAFSYPPL